MLSMIILELMTVILIVEENIVEILAGITTVMMIDILQVRVTTTEVLMGLYHFRRCCTKQDYTDTTADPDCRHDCYRIQFLHMHYIVSFFCCLFCSFSGCFLTLPFSFVVPG